MIICFDIDGTLCEEVGHTKYSEALPLSGVVEKVNHLSKTHSIIYFTSRPEIDRIITERWLRLHNFPIAPLFMGKPQADIYIDDKAVSSFESLDGFTNNRE